MSVSCYAPLNSLSTPIWIFDLDKKRIHWANDKSLSIWNSPSLDELLQRDMGSDMSEAVAATLESYRRLFEKHQVIKTWWSLSPADTTKTLLCHFSGITLDDGRLAMLVEVLGDENTLKGDIALSNNSGLALLFNAKGELTSSNRTFDKRFGHTLPSLKAFTTDAEKAESWLSTVQRDKIFSEEWHCWTGTQYSWFQVQGVWLDKRQQLLLTLIDINEQKQQIADAKYQAEHDKLTGLLNRTGLTQTMLTLQNQHQPFSLLFIDLEGFKLINDGYGHDVGDKLLNQVAKRLTQKLFNKGHIARLGSDEFVVLIKTEQFKSPDRLAKLLIQTLNQPFNLPDIDPLSIGCSIGLAHYPVDALDIETLLAQADMAMYEAKQRGRNRCHHFSPEMAADLQRKMRLRHRLSCSIGTDQLQLHFQPIYDINSRVLKGFEALIRWNDEELGSVSPGEFIPLAEETGQIVPLGSWILRSACQQLNHWYKKHNARLMMSVNLSRTQLQTGLSTYIAELMNKYDILPEQLALELTESAMLKDFNEAKQCINELAELGLELYLDDFGTGYSSLSQLQDLPISTVKLDQSFVQQFDSSGKAIVEATQAICKSLSLKLIAEGVETSEQLEYLRQCNFHYCQGYFLGRPMSAESIDEQRLLC